MVARAGTIQVRCTSQAPSRELLDTCNWTRPPCFPTASAIGMPLCWLVGGGRDEDRGSRGRAGVPDAAPGADQHRTDVLRYGWRWSRVVFLHGVLMNGTLWDSVVHDLQPGYRCKVPELPFGAHSRPMPVAADLAPLRRRPAGDAHARDVGEANGPGYCICRQQLRIELHTMAITHSQSTAVALSREQPPALAAVRSFYPTSSPRTGRTMTMTKTPARPQVSHRFG